MTAGEIKTLTVLIPCYNEEALVHALLRRVISAEMPASIRKQIVVIDDGSTDGSRAAIETVIKEFPASEIRLVQHTKNLGKGLSIRSGLAVATGEVTIIQDSDLEYDPSEYQRLLQPIADGHADVVYGSRFRGSEPHRVLFYFHTVGNKLLTFCSNVFTGLNLTDMETGYKMFRTEILQRLTLREKRFGFEPEVTARISKLPGVRIYEVGISYYGRGYEEGKKINWKDGVRAMYCIFKYNIFSRK